jgi:hypothetical protein
MQKNSDISIELLKAFNKAELLILIHINKIDGCNIFDMRDLLD